MIRVVLFDLGLTLIDSQNRPFPYVTEALTTIQSFTVAKGKDLTVFVSDFDMAAPLATPRQDHGNLRRYLVVLDGTGLRPFFEPVQRCVTVSTHAGVRFH